MAALGPCGTLASLSGPIVINEVTTVASVYALAQFTGGGGSGNNISYYGIAIDGASNVWISNKTNSSITEINHSGTAISPSTGYQSATLQGSSGVVIDASGNVWVLNSTPTVPFNGLETVTEFLGVTTPAGMPISESLPVV
jgi:hypothetical protein